jgi:hypothetical protein
MIKYIFLARCQLIYYFSRKAATERVAAGVGLPGEAEYVAKRQSLAAARPALNAQVARWGDTGVPPATTTGASGSSQRGGMT